MVLQFETAAQRSLPVSMLQHRIVCFKVTAVDEESKKQLLLVVAYSVLSMLYDTAS